MRVTIDIDRKRDLRKSLKKIRTLLGKGYISYIYKSPSGRGYHIIISNLNITWDESWILRQVFCDDKKRIKIDFIRDQLRQVTQVLWDRKGNKKAKILYDRKRKINILPITYRRYI